APIVTLQTNYSIKWEFVHIPLFLLWSLFGISKVLPNVKTNFSLKRDTKIPNKIIKKWECQHKCVNVNCNEYQTKK
ncbi:MAG: hypothetical protein KDC25_13855, partial [Saprospiraceae bacterium]|nr:hypothetical protein [Saprospiraceae bacterium]